MFILYAIVLVLLALAAAWWLSGYDPALTSDNKTTGYIRRILRCLVTVILVGLFFGLRPTGYWFVAVILVIPLSIAVLWQSCLSEWWSNGFIRLIESNAEGEFDPDKGVRELERVASLLRTGHREEALRLAHKLMRSGDANVLALEALLAHAGIDLKPPQPNNPLTQARHLRSQGNFVEAEKILDSHVKQNSSDIEAALHLIRLYAQDLKHEPKAMETLRQLEKQPHVPAWQIDYARRSIPEWIHAAPEAGPEPLPESIDELLAQGYSGTAIEILEQKIKEQPGDFDLWLKLAEAKGRYLGDYRAAEKIVHKMERDGGFSAEQIQTAKTKLAEWRNTK